MPFREWCVSYHMFFVGGGHEVARGGKGKGKRLFPDILYIRYAVGRVPRV